MIIQNFKKVKKLSSPYVQSFLSYVTKKSDFEEKFLVHIRLNDYIVFHKEWAPKKMILCISCRD